MNRQRGLWAGIFVLAILTGCSDDKTLNVEGAYSPVIVNLASDHQPPVRGDVNALTAVISNPRGYPVVYHWSTSAGAMTDSNTATVHWTPPDSVGVYPVTLSITAHDDQNNVDFFKTRTFQVNVDNQFERWTRSIATQFDVTPPVGGNLYFAQVRNAATGESDLWSLSAAMATPSQVTHDFWQASQPTVQADASKIVFLAKRRSSDGGASIYQLPPSGGDTTAAQVVVQWTGNENQFLGTPRFAPSGSALAYCSDTTSFNHFHPKIWLRDAGNFAVAPVPVMPTTLPGSFESNNNYWNPAWRGQSDSLVAESYISFGSPFQTPRGLFKFSATGFPPTNPEPFPVWLDDQLALEPDWSPNGQHIVFSKRSPGHLDRDIWIVNAAPASVPRQITFGPADDFHPRFAADGSIFFMSNRADGYGTNGVYETERRGVNVWRMSRFDRP